MVSIAVFQAVEQGSIPSQRSFVLQVLKTESDHEFESRTVRSVSGMVVSVAVFQAVESGSIPSQCSFVLQVLKTKSDHELSPGLVTNSLALCNCFYLADREKY